MIRVVLRIRRVGTPHHGVARTLDARTNFRLRGACLGGSSTHEEREA
jgi:hypothetical protein